MFLNILVAIDGSKISEKALDIAVEEAHSKKASLSVLYVVETGLFTHLPMDNTWEVIYSVLEKEGKNAIDNALDKAKSRGISVKSYIAQGHAGEEICKKAAETGAELIVVGSHGKRDVDRLLLGSVSTYVVTHSRITTMVVRA